MKSALFNGYKVNLVQSLEDIKTMLSTFNPKVNCGLDTETTGLDYIKDQVVGYCISGGSSYSPTDYQGYYLPVRHNISSQNLPLDVVVKVAQSILDNYKVCFWNRPFDFSMMEKDGIQCPFVGKTHDVQVMAHLVNSEHYPALKDFSQRYLKFNVIEFASNNAKDHNFGSTDAEVSFIYACFTPETRFLTRDGFKYFDDIKEGEEIAQYNPNTRSLEFVTPLRRVDTVSSELVSVNSNRIRFSVTPDHRVCHSYGRVKDVSESLAKDVYGKPISIPTGTKGYEGVDRAEPFYFESTIKKLPKGGLYDYQNALYLNADAFIELMGFFLGDGSCQGYDTTPRFSLFQCDCPKKRKTLEWLYDLNKRLGNLFTINIDNDKTYERRKNRVNAHAQGRMHYFTVVHKSLINFIRFNFFEDNQKTIPQWVFNLSIRQRKLFLNAFIRADGCRRSNRNCFHWDAHNPLLAKKMFELTVSVGYSCKLSEYSYRKVAFGKDYGYKTYWRCHISNLEWTSIRRCDWSYQSLNVPTRVVCFTVPSSFLLVEFHGKVCVSGNCGDPLLTVLLGRKLWSEYPYIRKIYPIDNIASETVRLLSRDTKLYLNKDMIEKELNRVTDEQQRIKNEIFSITGYSFRLTSNRDKSDALSRFTTLTKKTAKGDFAVSDEVLSTIDHPLARLFQRFAELEKYRGSYLAKLKDFPDGFHINYSTVNVPCLTEDNIVHLKDKGYKSIKYAKEGDLIFTRFGYKKILWQHSHEDDCVRVRLSDRFIEGNKHHPVLLLSPNGDPVWTGLGNLHHGDLIMVYDPTINDVFYKKVLGTVEVGRKVVYDIEVEDIHEFIANDIVTHNTGRLSSGASKGNDYFAALNIQNISKQEQKKYLHHDEILGYSLQPDEFNPLSSNTMLQTKSGSVPVSQLSVNDEVLTVDGYQPIESLSESDEVQVRDITLDDGTIITLPLDFHLKVKRDNQITYIKVSNLKETDILL